MKTGATAVRRYIVRPSATKGAATLYEIFDSREGSIVQGRLMEFTARARAEALNGSREIEQARRVQAWKKSRSKRA